jgi:hypothetical protein
MDKVELAKLRGATTTVVPRQVEMAGLIDQLRAMSEAHTRSQALLTETLNQMIRTIESKDLPATDVSMLTEAVLLLRPDPIPLDWTVDFERDQRSLMKTGIKLSAVR